MRRLVRTVLGDIPPGDLGVTFMHEHLIIDSPTVAETMEHIHLPSVDEAVAELTLCSGAGVSSVVDAMPAGSGRDINRLALASKRSNVHIIASTGMHTPKYYDRVPWAKTDSVEDLADRFIADIETGIDRFDYRGAIVDRTSHRAGIIKLATSTEETAGWDHRLFLAGAQAAAHTGAPILTHCEGGIGADRQLSLIDDVGVAPSRVAMSHTDKVADRRYHLDLLSSGVNLEYDQALRQRESADGGTAGLLRDMIEAGYLGQLMLGTDGARRSLWSSLGGEPGLAWLASGFRDAMRRVGIGETEQHALFVENPRRFLRLGARDVSSVA
ncbi:MAG: TatD family hydrolase [Actinomycetota bacterium]|nr:TatD family hydrolase [Actinomycetota bacterium]MDK1016529.1 TatD family hydrolase [Actinomycetota bacterium]MDK1025884.1 TatD family hydrolase [Actinomycetota bacterium]MDK1038641.1 TatD family hydrolase [Actinomycetota bacterium]MDK1096672.1 TatD family hydrolase [Actinomycetota bacterium]